MELRCYVLTEPELLHLFRALGLSPSQIQQRFADLDERAADPTDAGVCKVVIDVASLISDQPIPP